jgi:site-specific DNA-methyltransferase (adenine-specific)
MIVLAGNHTMQALAAEGHQQARCEIITCDDATARRINLADNRTAELGTYDEDSLASLLAQLEGDLDGTGWTDADIADLLTPPNTDFLDTAEPDDAPETPTSEPISKPGDVWLLGPHRLLCGDCTDMSAVEAMLDTDRCDAMWTDPPYGVDYTGKTKDALTIRNDGAAGLPDLLAGAFAVATAALKPGAPLYIAHPPGPLALDFGKAFLDAGWLLRQTLIWVKDALVLGRSDYHYRHEPILYGFTDAPAGSGRLGRGGERWFGDHAQTSVLEVPKPPRSEHHPTMKPVELVTRCLANSCPPKGLVYEPFGGSGTTLIAAHVSGFAARVVEVDPRYADVIARRFQTFTGTVPVLQATGEPRDFATAQANP